MKFSTDFYAALYIVTAHALFTGSFLFLFNPPQTLTQVFLTQTNSHHVPPR